MNRLRKVTIGMILLGLLASQFILFVPSGYTGGAGIVSDNRYKWHPLTVDFTGPFANETDDSPNPFLDYRLQVTFTSPNGQTYDVPGFFAGDGNGGGSGTVWRVRFSADAVGTWKYKASFVSGPGIAVGETPFGSPIAFDGAEGKFFISDPPCNAEGFLTQGRLEYVGEHYLKFRDGSYWIKGGTDSPENFLGYAGFDNTVDQGGLVSNFLHYYTPHLGHWQDGDPYFVSADTGIDSKGIIGALNYLAQKNVNSIYFLPMNLGGDGQETYPFVAPERTAYNKTHYDISKLEQWTQVLEHAQRNGIAIQMMLAETEPDNELWLDDGALGRERKLFYREMVARFGHLLALKWNLSEENDYSVESLQAFAGYIDELDWANHPIAVHTHLNDFDYYMALRGDERFSATAVQYTTDLAGSHVENWRNLSSESGRKWVIDMDENFDSLTSWNERELRKTILYRVYFSGGNLEWYLGYHNLPLGGDLRLEDFSTRKQMWDYTWYARRFMQDHLPFWEMGPMDHLLTNEALTWTQGQVFAKEGEVYAIYLSDASNGGLLDLRAAPHTFKMRWYNPETGQFAETVRWVTGGGILGLGLPPDRPNEDWVILLERDEIGTAVYGTDNNTYLPIVRRACGS